MNESDFNISSITSISTIKNEDYEIITTPTLPSENELEVTKFEGWHFILIFFGIVFLVVIIIMTIVFYLKRKSIKTLNNQ